MTRIPRSRILLAVLVLALVATPVLAHVPTFPHDNTSPDRAVEIPDAAKSWSFYDRLAPGQVRYYRFSLDAGQQLRVGTFTPGPGPFAPSFVVMSESLNGSEEVPDRVSVPEGMGAVVVAGERPGSASYEPFAPSANYPTADLDREVQADATYLVAVYEPANRSGQAGVAIGYREAFSPTEYVTVPFDLVQTRLWAGQGPLLVYGPILVTLVGGLAWIRRRTARETQSTGRTVLRYGLAVGALLVLGSAIGTLVQMGLALARTGPAAGALVTAAFVLVSAVCGAWALRVAVRSDPLRSRRTRVGLAVAGLASVATWGGFVVGPAVLLAAAVVPAGEF